MKTADYKYFKYKAFTLAEVLITLLIIGVVAAIVIPNLINDTQEAESKVTWKKTYSELDQATKKIMMDNGGTMKGYTKVSNSLYPLYKQYLNVIKYDSGLGLFNSTTNPQFNYKNLDKTNTYYGVALFDDGQMILNNGVFIAIENYISGPTTYDIIWVDVNGFTKGPNTFGKDVFGVEVLDTGIKPLGFQGDGYENTCITTSTGWGCSAKYLYQ